MIVLIVSDIHANLEAFEAVLAHAGAFDRLWFLGDAVGYGPDPNACVERLGELKPEVWLAGNHDWAALGKLDLGNFNPEARRAAEWTGDQLSPNAWAALDIAAPRVDLTDHDVTLVHGSPGHPIWEYILDAGTANANFDAFETAVCFFGHTHVPVAYEALPDGVYRWPYAVDEPLPLADSRWLVNPGGVGQPRDGDPRASYARLDLERRQVTFHRVAYAIPTVQRKILAAGLPPRLAARLDYGW